MISLLSCEDDNPYTEELNQILQETPFNKKVVENIRYFDSLEIILIQNMDVLFPQNSYTEIRLSSFKNDSIGFFHTIPSNEKTDSVIRAIEPFFTHLMNEEIVSEGIFNIDSTINIITKRDYIHKYPAKYFENLFNRDPSGSAFMSKDTFLINKWYYRLNLDRHYGW